MSANASAAYYAADLIFAMREKRLREKRSQLCQETGSAGTPRPTNPSFLKHKVGRSVLAEPNKMTKTLS